MTTDDAIDYLLPAMLNLGYRDSHKDALELEELLGSTEYKRWSGTSLDKLKPISKEYKRQLITLAGPYGKTILKMIRINNGLE